MLTHMTQRLPLKLVGVGGSVVFASALLKRLHLWLLWVQSPSLDHEQALSLIKPVEHLAQRSLLPCSWTIA
jgi:preprotein translocase subunit SecY